MKNQRPSYDRERELLLLGAKRNAVLELRQVRQYGSDSYGDADLSPSTACGPLIGIVRAPGSWDGRLSSARGTDWETRLATRSPRLPPGGRPRPGPSSSISSLDPATVCIGCCGIFVTRGAWVIVFIAPPWGDALDRTCGPDLRRTTPPITEIVDLLRLFESTS